MATTARKHKAVTIARGMITIANITHTASNRVSNAAAGNKAVYINKVNMNFMIFNLVRGVGLEPTTRRLYGDRSTN